MKRLAYVPLAALLLFTSAVSLSAEPANRPPGVTAEQWVPVSDRVGIVLVQAIGQGQPSPRKPEDLVQQNTPPLMFRPPVGGYFMVKLAGGWTRLVVIEPVKGPADVG